jgi:hypothetical protein
VGPTILAAVLVLGTQACGKDTGGAPNPVSERPEPREPADGTETRGRGDTGEAEVVERLPLEAEFHRTRAGLGTGLWVLGVVHNPHADRVAQVRVDVRLLDEAESIVGEAEARLARALSPGERAAVAVHLPTPVAHEQLHLSASARLDEGPEPTPLALVLTHEPPQRAELGGWYIVGSVTNPSADAIDQARVEIQGLDASGQLLGIDWLVLDPIEPGETIEFDVGDLRYEQDPTQFLLHLRRPSI